MTLCWHRTSLIVSRLRRRPEMCLTISQQPVTLHGTSASPANYCNFYLTDTWSAWSWRWLVIAASPLPLATATEQVVTPQERHPTEIRPGTPSLHLHLWTAKHRLHKLCTCRWSGNHACWWRLTGSGRSAEQRQGNRRWIPADLEVESQYAYYKNGVGSFPPQQGS